MSDASLVSVENALVSGITLATVLLAVFLHHEVLNTMYRRVLPVLGARSRRRTLLLVLVIFAGIRHL